MYWSLPKMFYFMYQLLVSKDLTQANCHRLYKPEERSKGINGKSYQLIFGISFDEILGKP